MQKRKISKEEMEALLVSFDLPQLHIRSIRHQSKLFQAAFVFINLYVVTFVLTSHFFSDVLFVGEVTPDLSENYREITSARLIIALILLSLANLSFFFLENAFRFLALISFAYLFNGTIDLITIFGPYFEFSQVNIALIFYTLRPISLLAIAVCILTFEPYS